jgi:signal transduction histidine kinase/HD-like signal output (HDOD) protein
MDRASSEIALSRLDALPPLSERTIEFLRRAGTPARIAARIDADAALAQRLLAYGREIAPPASAAPASVAELLERFGSRHIGVVTLALELVDYFGLDRNGAADGDVRAAWRHSLAVGLAARHLALTNPRIGVNPEDAFGAGLVHDVGMLALAAVFPRAYKRVIERVASGAGSVADVEQDVLSVDHFVAGRRLAERWNLPPPLQECIWLHGLSLDSLPQTVTARELIALIHVADALVRERRLGMADYHVQIERATDIARQLGLTPADISAALADLESTVEIHERALCVTHTPRLNAALGTPRWTIADEAAAGPGSAGALARELEAIRTLAQRVAAGPDLRSCASGLAAATCLAYDQAPAAAFVLHPSSDAAELCVHDALLGTYEQTVRLDAVIVDSLAATRERPESRSLPALVRAIFNSADIAAGFQGRACVPISHGDQIVGGLVLAEPAEGEHTLDGPRDFLATAAMVLVQARASALARRLADELAGANRRIQNLYVGMLRSRALSMIAEMAAGAGHELNSPLAVISGRAQMLRQQTSDPQLCAALELIDAKARECSGIVSELMDFARPRAPRLEDIDVLDFLRTVHAEWQARSGLPPSRVELDLLPRRDDGQPIASPPATRFRVDREQLRAALFELLDNAAEATAQNQGVIEILWRPCQRPLDAGAGESISGAPISGAPAAARPCVELRIRDAGCGMTPAVLERAFDPFFSHRRAGRGRGLGLARVYRSVEAHGGRMWIESQPDQGTTVHLLLPGV